MKKENRIKIKTPDEIKILRQTGGILASIIRELKRSLKTGITTKEIDSLAEELIYSHKALPAFKGYRGFPACTCISVNEEVVHGIPGKKVIKSGDIISIDVGIIFQQYFSDMAFTMGLGDLSPRVGKLLEVAEKSLYQGIQKAVVGNHLSDISFAIQDYVESHDLTVVRDFVGHGIGRSLHEDPEIPNYGLPQKGPILKEGMVFAIEPMVNLGTWQTETLDDGWTVVTKDGEPSAHFEHTVAVLDTGPEILTLIK